MPGLNSHVDEVFEAKTVVKLGQFMLPAGINIEQLSASTQCSFRAERGNDAQFTIVNRRYAKMLDQPYQWVELLGVMVC